MQTTSVYIEHIIIGAEVSAWLFGIAALVDSRTIGFLQSSLSSIPLLVIFFGICYVLGIVFDRQADLIVKRVTVDARGKYGIPPHLVHGEYLKEEYLVFALSRMRIVRSTALNLLPIGLSLFLLLLIRYHLLALALLCLCGCFLFSVVCFFTYKSMEKGYYAKLRTAIDEKEREKKTQAEKT